MWVIKQGEDGDTLYLIDSGELDCYKRFSKDGENVHLKVYNPGESFGELALLYNAPRAASIQAKSDCVLFALDRECFNNIVKESAIKRRERYDAFLQKVELLSSMDPYERSQISEALKMKKVSAGDYVIRQGEQGDTFYIIEKGDLIALKSSGPGIYSLNINKLNRKKFSVFFLNNFLKCNFFFISIKALLKRKL